MYEILNVRKFYYPVLHGLYENLHLRKFPVRYVRVSDNSDPNTKVDYVVCINVLGGIHMKEGCISLQELLS